MPYFTWHKINRTPLTINITCRWRAFILATNIDFQLFQNKDPAMPDTSLVKKFNDNAILHCYRNYAPDTNEETPLNDYISIATALGFELVGQFGMYTDTPSTLNILARPDGILLHVVSVDGKISSAEIIFQLSEESKKYHEQLLEGQSLPCLIDGYNEDHGVWNICLPVLNGFRAFMNGLQASVEHRPLVPFVYVDEGYGPSSPLTNGEYFYIRGKHGTRMEGPFFRALHEALNERHNALPIWVRQMTLDAAIPEKDRSELLTLNNTARPGILASPPAP